MEKTKAPDNTKADTVIEDNGPLPSQTISPPKQKVNDPENLRHEYTQINEDIRHYSNLRFAIFTVYFAALGGLISVAFGLFEVKAGNPEQVMFWGRVGGLLVTLLFFYYEVRIQSFINHSFRRGRELEPLLGYKRISTRPSWGKFRSHHATIIFFLTLIVFWCVTILKKL